MIMDIMNKQDKSPEILQSKEKRQDVAKPANLRLKIDSTLNQKVWVPRLPDDRRRDEVVEIDLKILLRNNERSRLWGIFQIQRTKNKPKHGRIRQLPSEHVSSTE